MASAFQDKHGWIADFRPLFEKKHRRVRIPASESDPLAYAKACERYCRLLETAWPAEADISTALELRAITEAQALALRGGEAVPAAAAPRKRPQLSQSLEDCWKAHPSTQREEKRAPDEYDKHLAGLNKFTEWSGIKDAGDLTLDLVQSWIAHLRAEGYAYGTRRHYLVPIRRAAMMGARLHGLIDPVARLKLDEDDGPAPVEVWSLQELAALAAARLDAKDYRGLSIVALGGFLGLRPSEILRFQAADVRDDVLEVGRLKRKNMSSHRFLPLPSTITPWLKELPDEGIRGHEHGARRGMQAGQPAHTCPPCC